MRVRECCCLLHGLAVHRGYSVGLIAAAFQFLHSCECFDALRSSWCLSTFLIHRMSLAFAFLTFLTTIWGEGIAFTWLLNVTGISALLVWTSIGVISIRFREAYKAQGYSLSDLPYRQPLYPLLPIGVIILGTLMFIAQGYAAVRQEPFEPRVSIFLWGFSFTPFR